MILQRFLRDRKGAAAVELALVAPVIAVTALASFAIWQTGTERHHAAAALNAGAEYYLNGGVEDSQAKALAMTAWSNKPGDGAIEIVRACRCGVTAIACETNCTDGSPPAIYAHMTATGVAEGFNGDVATNATRVLRVR